MWNPAVQAWFIVIKLVSVNVMKRVVNRVVLRLTLVLNNGGYVIKGTFLDSAFGRTKV